MPTGLDTRLVPRTALAERVAAVAGAGGVAIVAAEAGTGKTALAREALALLDGRAVRLHDGVDRLGGPALAGLGRALVTRPQGTGAIVTGRGDPGLCLNELRGTGAVLELAGEDLAWSEAEVADGLDRWGADGDAARLAHATEGWCAAVRLAALVGEHALAPTSAPLVDYVFGDALRGAPPELEEALLRLSFAGTFDARAAAAATGGERDGDDLLAALHRRRLFVRAAGAGRWRVHRLVAAVARRRLTIVEPAVARTLRLRGTDGDGDDVQAGDPEAVTDATVADPLLAGHAWELLLDGALARPSPEALRVAAAGPPPGRLAAALGLLATGDAATADALLALDGGAPAADPVRATAQIMSARLRGDLAATVDGAEALDRLPGVGLGLRALALTERGVLEHDFGELAAAREHLELAGGLADHAGRPVVSGRARGALALLCLGAGRLFEATRHAEAALSSTPARFAVGRVRAGVTLALVAYLRDELTVAGERALRTRHDATGSRDPVLWLHVLLQDVLIAEALGEYDRASLVLAEARSAAARHPVGAVRAPLLDLLHVRLLEHVGRTDEAARAVEAFPRSLDTDLALARRHLREQRPREAMATLATWIDEAGRDPALEGRVGWHLVTFAVAAAAVDDDQAAHRALERALDLTAPEIVRRPFVEERVRLRPLLKRHLVGETKHGAFVADLLERTSPDERAATPDALLRAPLTDRERTVLGYLPSAMTAAEIAAALVVSEATVRTHLRHIYEKLGVTGRRDAVRRAGELRLLAQDPSPNRYK